MKQRLFILYILAFMLGVGGAIKAQPSQKRVQVIVSPDHSDWKYKVKEEAVFSIQVLTHGNPVENVTVDYELGPEFFPTITQKELFLKDGRTTLKASMAVPGFLRCKVTARVGEYTYEGMATVAVEEGKIMPTTSEPKDFDRFWDKAIEEARQTPLDPKTILIPEKCTSTQNYYYISFQNEKAGSRIYGVLKVPKKAGKYPAVLQVPGAGIRPYGGMYLDEDVITLEIGIHGIPVNLPQEVYSNLNYGALSNYWSINTNNRDTHYYKRVYIGCVRAVDFIYSLPEFDGQTVGVTGGSQGGALSIVTAGLDARIRFLAAFYPALCDFAGYLNKRAGGWPHYFRNTQPQPGENETLPYFDVVNFARRVQVPGWYSWGYNDTVCPPTSMHAAYNVIPGPKEWKPYVETGHWTFPEQRNEFSDWIKKMYRK